MQRGGFLTRMLVFGLLLAWVPAALAVVPDEQRAGLVARAQPAGTLRLIVQVGPVNAVRGRASVAQIRQQQGLIAQQQSRVAASAAGPGFDELARFKFIPYMLVAADARGITRLAGLTDVLAMVEDVPEPPALLDSTVIIGADTAWAGGFDGSGQAVAVLDTGVDLAHSYFSAPGKIPHQACFSSEFSATITSLCPGGVTESTAPGSGAACPASVRSCDHGSHVAGIVAGHDGSGPRYGVARGAMLIPIQVYTRFNEPSSCGGGPNTPCALSYPSDQIQALEHVLELSESTPIAAVNMSLGGGSFSDQASCDAANTARKAALDNLRAVGVAPVISSGNSGLKSSMGQPGCISGVISVGATTKLDVVAYYSNIAPFISLLAPGSEIVSSVPGGGTTALSGTSMAAPHVAGAWAVLRQAAPAASVDAILAALRETGTVINDTRIGGSVNGMRRINLDLALAELQDEEAEFESTPAQGQPLDFGLLRVASTGQAVLSVTNAGVVDLTLACALNGADAGRFALIQCPALVPAAAQMDVVVECSPLAVGALSATLDITTNDSDEPSPSFSLQCAGGEPEFSSDPVPSTVLDFGNVEMQTSSAALDVDITNSGSFELAIGCSIAGADAADFAIVQCPNPVAAAASAAVQVQCTPSAAGARAASLELTSDDADEPAASYPLSCFGTQAEIDAVPAAGEVFDFGTVHEGDSSAQAVIDVSNSGDASLTLECSLGGAHAAEFVIDQCPASIAAAMAAQVKFHCQPGGGGEFSATLSLTSNDADEPVLGYTLLCNGTAEVIFRDGLEALPAE